MATLTRSSTKEQKQLAFELHRPSRKRFAFRPVEVKGYHETWQSDLVEMKHLKKWNKNNNYLLTVIDIGSKYAYAEAVRRKTGQDVTAAFRKVLKRHRGRPTPTHLHTDQGKEFFNKTFAALMKEYGGINHYHTWSERKASIVERFNRTLKSKMYRYFTEQNTLVWINILPKLVSDYNNTKHRTIGMAPSKVNARNMSTILKRLKQKNEPIRRKRKKTAATASFKLDDIVRVSRFKRPVFDKGYTGNWSEELFKITSLLPDAVYRLTDLMGEPIEGTFYAEELQKTKIPDYARIERVLARKTRKSDGEKLLRVKWKGYSSKFNQWIPASHAKGL